MNTLLCENDMISGVETPEDHTYRVESTGQINELSKEAGYSQ